MGTVITFSDLSVGDPVGGQFTDDYGITFISPLGKVASDPKSPFSNVLPAANDGGGVEFPTWSIKGTLSSPNHSRFGISVNRSVTMTLKDENGKVISNYFVASPQFQADGSYFSGEFATGKANIASFEIHDVSDHTFCIASITFDMAGVSHRPDFRLMFSDASIPDSIGKTGFISVIVARLYGSTGPLELAVSSSPPGLFNPSAVTSTGAEATLVLVAKENVQLDNIITVTGTPSVASAGTVKRAMNYAYSPPLEPPL
jgi:hypothetical protein